MDMNIRTIGILGSGQLGRMLAIAAAQRGVRAHIFAPDAQDSPAAEVAYRFTQASYSDTAALASFASEIDAVTSEFENVPAEAMRFLSQHIPASPGAKALHIAQNRLREKQLAQSLGIATPRYWRISSAQELKEAISEIDDKAILKTSEQGYDGKGQIRIHKDTDADTAWQQLKTSEAILEAFIPFRLEISVLVWRDKEGGMGVFPISQNEHRNGILYRSHAPAPDIDDMVRQAAEQAAYAIADAVELLGILALEAFVTEDGQVIFNEIAPRPHNSFHWTIEGCLTSQFTQTIRMITDEGAGHCDALGEFMMQNLLGEDADKFAEFAKDPAMSLHLYGKTSAKTGRKMGHVTTCLNSIRTGVKQISSACTGSANDENRS